MALARILVDSFLDGYSAPLLIFKRIPRPGSHSAELADLTTPDMLAAYERVCPSVPGLLLEMKEKEHKRDAMYSKCVRFNGYLGWMAIVCAITILVLNR